MVSINRRSAYGGTAVEAVRGQGEEARRVVGG